MYNKWIWFQPRCGQYESLFGPQTGDMPWLSLLKSLHCSNWGLFITADNYMIKSSNFVLTNSGSYGHRIEPGGDWHIPSLLIATHNYVILALGYAIDNKYVTTCILHCIMFCVAVPRIAFTANDFQVFENESSVNIAITRSGDLSSGGTFQIKTLMSSSMNAAICKL